MKKTRGFTLIELLVVIAIIAVLMSILMPALNRAKLSAQDSMCMSNQHTFGLFWKLWTDEHEGRFPVRGSGSDPWGSITMNKWPFVMWDYMSSMDQKIWYCPAATIPFTEGGRPPYAAWDQPSGEPPPAPAVVYGSYTVNLWISNDTDYEFWRTPSAKGIANTPILMDGNWKDTEPQPDDEPPPYPTYWWEANENEMKRVCITRHGRYVNAIFGDWSAKKVGLKFLWVTRWHRAWFDVPFPLPNPSWPGGDWPEWMQPLPEPSLAGIWD